MDSSTSRFKQLLPREAVQLVIAAVVFWILSAAYMLRLNPEVGFLSRMAAIQNRYAEKMQGEYGRKILVVGGSSTMFSIRGEQLLESEKLPVVNMGLNARLGAQVICERALSLLRPGDTLVLAIEPGLLTGSIEPPHAGIAFSYAAGHPGWARSPVLSGHPLPLLSSLVALRPGADHFLIAASKLVTRKPSYIYSIEDASPSGWNHTARRVPLVDEAPAPLTLPLEFREYLASLKTWANANQVRVCYSLPWRWAPAESQPRLQKENAKFLLQMGEFLPVLRDPQLGVHAQIDDFSDTIWHLNEKGSALRTEQLGRQLKDWQLWPSEELRSAAR